MAEIIGYGPCLCCSMERPYKTNKKDHLYVYCVHPADGGCGGGFTSRSKSGDELLARKVTRWKSKEVKKQWLGETEEAPDPVQSEEVERAQSEGDLQETPVIETPPQQLVAPLPQPPSPRQTVARTIPAPPTSRPQRRAPPKPQARRKPLLTWEDVDL